MINHVQPTRLFRSRWLIAAALGGLALNASAALTLTNIDGIEYRQSGNTFTWGPATAESTTLRGGTAVKSDVSVSTTTPKADFKTDLPYKNNGGAAAKTTMSASIDPSKVSAKAAQALSKAAKGAGYLGLASFACGLSTDCTAALDALLGWGASELKKNNDGSVSAVSPDPSSTNEVSDGNMYRTTTALPWALSKSQACSDLKAHQGHPLTYTVNGEYCDRQGTLYVFYVSTYSSCPAGSPIVNGVCNGSAPKIETPLQTYINSNYTGKGWDDHWAKMTAEIIANGGNVFTDGTSVDITGPAMVPIVGLSTTATVNVVPGTTNVAPPGHTGPTEPGKQTTTSTTSAKNTFTSGPFSSGSSASPGGSPGGSTAPASGPKLTATQTTTTVTTVTNNVTNVTNVISETTTETDAPPEKKEDEEKPDHCEKNKDTLGCAELDEVEQDLPRKNIDLSYEYSSLFGNGSCPADKYLSTHGQTLKVWDWQTSCDHIVSYFQPVLLACCAFAAFVIVAAGGKE